MNYESEFVRWALLQLMEDEASSEVTEADIDELLKRLTKEYYGE